MIILDQPNTKSKLFLHKDVKVIGLAEHPTKEDVHTIILDMGVPLQIVGKTEVLLKKLKLKTLEVTK